MIGVASQFVIRVGDERRGLREGDVGVGGLGLSARVVCHATDDKGFRRIRRWSGGFCVRCGNFGSGGCDWTCSVLDTRGLSGGSTLGSASLIYGAASHFSSGLNTEISKVSRSLTVRALRAFSLSLSLSGEGSRRRDGSAVLLSTAANQLILLKEAADDDLGGEV